MNISITSIFRSGKIKKSEITLQCLRKGLDLPAVYWEDMPFCSGFLSEILVYLMLASLFTEKDAVQACEENSRLQSSTDQTISDDPT